MNYEDEIAFRDAKIEVLEAKLAKYEKSINILARKLARYMVLCQQFHNDQEDIWSDEMASR